MNRALAHLLLLSLAVESGAHRTSQLLVEGCHIQVSTLLLGSRLSRAPTWRLRTTVPS